MLKGQKEPTKGRKPLKVRKGREHDGAHLATIRRLPCMSCDADPAGTAAHVRMSGNGKPLVGMSTKPDDKWTLPLCDACHTEAPAAQHKVGEVRFWAALGIDPLVVCERLNAASPDIEAMRAIVLEERQRRT